RCHAGPVLDTNRPPDHLRGWLPRCCDIWVVAAKHLRIRWRDAPPRRTFTSLCPLSPRSRCKISDERTRDTNSVNWKRLSESSGPVGGAVEMSLWFDAAYEV